MFKLVYIEAAVPFTKMTLVIDQFEFWYLVPLFVKLLVLSLCFQTEVFSFQTVIKKLVLELSQIILQKKQMENNRVLIGRYATGRLCRRRFNLFSIRKRLILKAFVS